ncbi:hypothetical protein OAU99_03385 [Candidatus Poseidoniaceae archaeon]|jgi:hypothetical protein|nr:hypothetical protein [Candidatus Poseidoniaceae archaeon]
MVNWALDYDDADTETALTADARPASRPSRRKVSRRTRTKSKPLSSANRVTKLIDGKLVSLRIRRVVRKPRQA